MAKISQRQVVAELTPVNSATAPSFGTDGAGTNPVGGKPYWPQVSGGEITASVEKVYDGGQSFPETLCAPAEISDITVTRHYDPTRDGTTLQQLRSLVGRARYNILIYDLNCDLAEPGTQRVYNNALLIGITEPEGDSSSGAPATFSLTFSISSVSGSTS